MSLGGKLHASVMLPDCKEPVLSMRGEVGWTSEPVWIWWQWKQMEYLKSCLVFCSTTSLYWAIPVRVQTRLCHMKGNLWCILLSIAGRNHNIKIRNKSFENVEQFRCLGTALANQNFIHEEIKSRLKPRYTCCNLLQILFFFQFAIQKYKN